MTENEVFEHIGDLAGDYKCFDEKISHQESLILCNLIEEVQQYRAIGTVEGYENAIKAYTETYILMKEYKSKVQDFESIGTIEEFKALKEKKNVLLIATIKINKEDMQEIVDEIVDEMIEEVELDIQKIRAKAIDEFVEKAYFILGCEDSDIYCKESIKEIAEQMKEGVKNA